MLALKIVMGLKNPKGKGINFHDPYPWGVYLSCTLGPFSRVRVLKGRVRVHFSDPGVTSGKNDLSTIAMETYIAYGSSQ